jgi:hypothetical protein
VSAALPAGTRLGRVFGRAAWAVVVLAVVEVVLALVRA